jgi:hypothetical protein
VSTIITVLLGVTPCRLVSRHQIWGPACSLFILKNYGLKLKFTDHKLSIQTRRLRLLEKKFLAFSFDGLTQLKSRYYKSGVGTRTPWGSVVNRP